MLLTAQANDGPLSDLLSLSGLGPALLAAGVLGLIILLMLYTAVLSRRRLGSDVRAIVQTLEEFRSGKTRGRPEVDPGSPLMLVSDAVQRLGLEMNSNRVQAETAAERWRALTDATRDTAVVTTDTDGDIRSFSAGAAWLLGWDEEEVLARPAAVLFDENAYKDLLPKLARRSVRTQGVTTRSTLVRRDGSSLQAEVSVRLLMGAASQPVGFMMVVRDIGDQIRMEHELRESERRYRGLVEGLAEGVIIVKGGRLAYVNPAAEALCGRKAGEVIGTAWRDQIATADVLVVESALGEIESGRRVGELLRCSLVGPDGAPRADVRIKAGPVEFDGGPAVLLLVRDETSERRIERELRCNEARLDAVLEATSDGILVLSENRGTGMVQMTNLAFAEMVGVQVKDLLGASEDRLVRLLHERGEGAEAIAACIAGDSSSETISLGGSAPKEVQVIVAALIGHSGEPLGRVVACRDLTEQRRSERELQAQAEKLQLSKLELEQSYRKLNEVNSRLQTRSEELDQLNQELQRLDEMKSDLLGNVSHELQTPLVSIRGYTEMILKERLGPISEEQRKGLTLSLKNIDRLISMIDNLLAFTRTDPSLRDLKLTQFDLRALVDEVVELLRERISAKALQLSVGVERDDIVVQADRDKILQVFVNLLANAVKFSRERGAVEVAASGGQAGYATVRVRDTGVGVPREAIDRIFERHYRVERGTGDEPRGSGIGLAIVRDILRLHGCTIRVESEEGRGTEFTFTLPLAREATGRQLQEPGIPRGPEPEEKSNGDGEASSNDRPSPEPKPRLRIIRRGVKS